MLLLALLWLAQAPDLESREAFERTITAGDEKALETVAGTSDRARLALAEIRAHKRFGDCYPPVKLISFHAKDQPLRRFVDDFSKALGVAIEDYHKYRGLKAGEAFTLDLDGAYALEAFDKLMVSINAQGWQTDKGFQFTRGVSLKNLHTCYGRHVALSPYQLTMEKTLDPFGRTTETCTLMVSFRKDSSASIVGIRPVKSLEAVDDRGAPIKSIPDPEPTSYQFKILLEPTAATTRIARIRGSLPLVIPEKRISNLVPLGARNVSLEFAQWKVTVESLSEAGTEARIVARLHDSAQSWPPLNFHLVDKGDVELTGRCRSSWIDKQVILEFTFDLPAGFTPANLKISSFEKLGDHEIPFEFTDVRIR